MAIIKPKQLMQEFLEKTPQARCRKYMYRVIGRIMQKNHIGFDNFSIEILESHIKDILALDRDFRLVMNENDWWSEEDKENKKVLEQKKMQSLGYEAGFEQVNKRLLAEFDKA
jgi:hypothetical protein